MKSSEFKRWLTKLGATFVAGKGSHFHVFLNGRRSIIPMHNKELGTGVLNQIKKDLGLKNEGSN
jgi:mRNA interferase HicA